MDAISGGFSDGVRGLQNYELVRAGHGRLTARMYVVGWGGGQMLCDAAAMSAAADIERGTTG